MEIVTLMAASLLVSTVAASPEDARPTAPALSCHLVAERSLAPYGGIPLPVDLDGDGASEVLWLQSPGLFHSDVFDCPPWKGRFTDEERDHFCLTATDGQGAVRWQIGEPWTGERPFVSHSAERALDCADIDGDGVLEVVCARRDELLVIDAETGAIKQARKAPADNAQIVRVARTGPAPTDWTILLKNAEKAYGPHEYANPAWFYNADLELLKTAGYLGAGHTPLAADVDGDGFDEFIIGFNLVDHDLETLWTFEPVPAEAWNAGEMHVDDMVLGELNGKPCAVFAASDTTCVVDLQSGGLLWKCQSAHPQHCQIGRFHPDLPGNQVFVHNKRAELQLFDSDGRELWRMMPPPNFPLGAAAPCERQMFHVFDPTTVLHGLGPAGTDLLVFTDAGWPYVIDGRGQRCIELPSTQNAAQDWGEVPGRPDDYGYGYYARVADFDGDGAPELLVNDRRFAWLYEIERRPDPKTTPRSDGRVLNADLENYVDGVVQPLNAGLRWLGDPFAGRNEGTIEITRDFAFSGTRCAHVETREPGQIGRVRFQQRFDAPTIDGDTVAEVVFRPARSDAADLEDLTVWSAGPPVALDLLANGDADSGTYWLDVVHGAPAGGARARTDRAVQGLDQGEWTRIIIHRRRSEGLVDLWVGPPENESYIGAYPDLNPDAHLGTLEIGDTSEGRHRGSGYWDDLRIGGLLAPGQHPAPPEPPLRDVGMELADIELPIPVGSEKQLFVDDVLIESATGLERTLHQVEKHPDNPLLVADRPWEGLSVLLYGAVIRDPDSGRFRMWYLAWGKHVGQSSYICYAESEDGLHWTKPNLGLHEFKGSKQNNIVIPNVTSNTTVMYDPRDPDASRRYKAVIRDRGTRAWLSPDGIHWRDHGVIMDQCYDSTTVHWDPVGNKWIASVKIFRDGKRARGYAESADFFHWSDTYFMATVDERDAPDDQMYAMIVFRYESVYLGLLRILHEQSDVVDVQLASGRNAKHWDRLVRTPLVPCSTAKGAWDYGNNSPSTDPPIRVGDALWLYYSGRGTTHGEKPNTGAIGLGTLRLDGFVSMDAGQAGGELTTKPCLLQGGRLYVNVDVAGGSLRAELIDESGRTIDPYTSQNCGPVESDSIQAPLSWRGADDLSPLKDRPVRIRFHLTNAKLYAFCASSAVAPPPSVGGGRHYQRREQAMTKHRKWHPVLLAGLCVLAAPAQAQTSGECLPESWHVDRDLYPRAYGVLANEQLMFPVDMSDWPVKIDHARQFFVDDYLVADMTNLTRELHQPVKHPANPLLVGDRPWEGAKDGEPGSVCFQIVRRDDQTGLFRMWYAGYHRFTMPDGVSVRFPACYAESKDGIHWEKPELGLHEFEGSKANNIVIPAGNLYGLHKTGTVPSERVPERDGTVPVLSSERGPVFLGIVWHEPEYVPREGYFLYTSPDGIHWTRERDEPLAISLLGYTMPQSGIGDTSIFRWDRLLGKYVCDSKFVLPGKFRCRGMMESDDLFHWTPPRMTIYPDGLDHPDSQIYGHLSFCYESMWLGFLRVMHMHAGWKQTTCELTSSRDGRHWRRAARREEFIPLGEPTEWDADYHDPCWDPILVGDELWIYYRSVNRRPGDENPKVGHAVGLATLRRDGFVSLNAGETPGTVVTRPLTFPGTRLFVNAEVAEGGWVKAGVLSTSRESIDGRTLEQSVPVRADTTRAPLVWANDQGLPALDDAHVRLVFGLRNAKLYSFWVE